MDKIKIKNQTANEEARKIALEKRFMPTIKSLFSRMAKAFEDLYMVTGTIVNFNSFEDDWSAALKIQYNRVGREFSNNARKSAFLYGLLVKADEDDLSIEEVAALGAAYLLFSQNRARIQTRFIIDTSNRDALGAVQLSIREIREENPLSSPSNEDVARRASGKLRTRFRGRTGVIANMETQAPAEEAKKLEALSLAGVAILPFQPIDALPDKVIKDWDTVGDELVRLSHAEADSQRQAQEDPFIVGGEKLQYPGDTSLGATIGNVANCRCSARYSKA